MISPIRKRCPKCKATDIYKRRRLKDVLARSRYIHVIRSNVPRNMYLCSRCGHEFDNPFIGPKTKLDVKTCDKSNL
jgi:DNA-directed RNA polymerase subunit RPC12/RpoP